MMGNVIKAMDHWVLVVNKATTETQEAVTGYLSASATANNINCGNVEGKNAEGNNTFNYHN